MEEAFHVVLMTFKIAGEPFEQFGMARHVTGVHLIGGMHDSSAHECGPHPVDECPSEECVSVGGDIRKCFPSRVKRDADFGFGVDVKVVFVLGFVVTSRPRFGDGSSVEESDDGRL